MILDGKEQMSNTVESILAQMNLSDKSAEEIAFIKKAVEAFLRGEPSEPPRTGKKKTKLV